MQVSHLPGATGDIRFSVGQWTHFAQLPGGSPGITPRGLDRPLRGPERLKNRALSHDWLFHHVFRTLTPRS